MAKYLSEFTYIARSSERIKYTREIVNFEDGLKGLFVLKEGVKSKWNPINRPIEDDERNPYQKMWKRYLVKHAEEIEERKHYHVSIVVNRKDYHLITPEFCRQIGAKGIGTVEKHAKNGTAQSHLHLLISTYIVVSFNKISLKLLKDCRHYNIEPQLITIRPVADKWVPYMLKYILKEDGSDFFVGKYAEKTLPWYTHFQHDPALIKRT